jgi:hypothetical protein
MGRRQSSAVHALVEQRFQFYCRTVAQLTTKTAYRRRDSEDLDLPNTLETVGPDCRQDSPH